jgi:hypothetical protein
MKMAGFSPESGRYNTLSGNCDKGSVKDLGTVKRKWNSS